GRALAPLEKNRVQRGQAARDGGLSAFEEREAARTGDGGLELDGGHARRPTIKAGLRLRASGQKLAVREVVLDFQRARAFSRDGRFVVLARVRRVLQRGPEVRGG